MSESSIVTPPEGVRPGAPGLSYSPSGHSAGRPFLLTVGVSGVGRHWLSRAEVEFLRDACERSLALYDYEEPF